MRNVIAKANLVEQKALGCQPCPFPAILSKGSLFLVSLLVVRTTEFSNYICRKVIVQQEFKGAKIGCCALHYFPF
jgi:hypothetical protein